MYCHEGYPHVCHSAARETPLLLVLFPEQFPWTVEQVPDQDFWLEDDAS
jgi:hypothetical protein